MNIISLKPGHDGCIAFVANQELVFSVEAEKDSFSRHGNITAQLVLQALEMAPSRPDVVALSGWHKVLPAYDTNIGAGYFGIEQPTIRSGRLFGTPLTLFSSTHERAHIFMIAGMYPNSPPRECSILTWEGRIGAFYHWRDGGASITRQHILSEPGARYSSLFALADPAFPEQGRNPSHEYAGKLMALAAFDLDYPLLPEDRAVVDALMCERSFYPFNKKRYEGSALYNCGVELPRFHSSIRYLTDSIFGVFYRAAKEFARMDIPLLISGGCGLNCDWNQRWREARLFEEVFVAPCSNDSGSAIGTACDALNYFGESFHLNWSVYAGADFEIDEDPAVKGWEVRPADPFRLANRIKMGHVIPWVQGRCEIGPRALGNRSLLASPLLESNRVLLNKIKERESYRPVAPSCRSEELTKWFDPNLDDPYMLYFSKVRTSALPAVTHVDGTARVHSVRKDTSPRLHELLEVCRLTTGYGVLCNTSLNFKGYGFINRMSDLLRYCDVKGLSDFVVKDLWYVRARSRESG